MNCVLGNSIVSMLNFLNLKTVLWNSTGYRRLSLFFRQQMLVYGVKGHDVIYFHFRCLDPGGICCPDSQVQRDCWWVHSPQWQNLESHTCWAEPARHEQKFCLDCSPSFPTPNTVLKGWGWGWGDAFVQSPGLPPGGVFLQLIFKGFLLAPGWGTALQDADQERCRNDSMRRPHLSCLCNWGWTNRFQQAALGPLLGDLGLQYLSVFAVGVFQYSRGLQEDTNSSVSLARPRLPLQCHCPYKPPTSSCTK